MTNQVDHELLLDEKDVVSWADTSENLEEVLELALAPVPMITEGQLDIAYNVFAGYASCKQGNYPDVIMRDLRLAGVAISGREELLWICNSLIGYFLIQEKERYFTFSWQGAENENVQQRKPQASKTVIFSVLALAAFVSVSAGAVSLAHLRSSVSDKPIAVKHFPATIVTRPVGAIKVVEKVQAPVNNQGISDSINVLIDSGRFSLALKVIRNSTDLTSSDFVIKTKKRINVLVLLKVDSLSQVIKDLVEEKKYFEAFELEQCFDKDVFQLKSSAFARQLRQNLVSDWVYSYKGWASKEEAIEDVTEQVRKIMKSPNYEVVKGDGDKFYLEYGLSKNRKKA